MKNLLFARTQCGKFFRWSFSDDDGQHHYQVNLDQIFTIYANFPPKNATSQNASIYFISTTGHQERIDDIEPKVAKLILAAVAPDSAVFKTPKPIESKG